MSNNRTFSKEELKRLQDDKIGEYFDICKYQHKEKISLIDAIIAVTNKKSIDDCIKEYGQIGLTLRINKKNELELEHDADQTIYFSPTYKHKLNFHLVEKPLKRKREPRDKYGNESRNSSKVSGFQDVLFMGGSNSCENHAVANKITKTDTTTLHSHFYLPPVKRNHQTNTNKSRVSHLVPVNGDSGVEKNNHDNYFTPPPIPQASPIQENTKQISNQVDNNQLFFNNQSTQKEIDPFVIYHQNSELSKAFQK